MAELIKNTPTGLECTPEGVQKAVKDLGGNAEEAKNALANCTAYIKEKTAGRKIS